MAEIWNNFEKFEKKNQILALFSSQRPPDDWPDMVVIQKKVCGLRESDGTTDHLIEISSGILGQFFYLPYRCYSMLRPSFTMAYFIRNLNSNVCCCIRKACIQVGMSDGVKRPVLLSSD